MSTIKIKIIEIYETTIEVPAHLTYEYRREYAGFKRISGAIKPVRVATRYTEKQGLIDYKEFLNSLL